MSTIAERRNATLPAYYRLYVLLSEHIKDGRYPAGGLLPSEKALTQSYNVSRVTVRRALDQLVEDGLVTKHQGQGTIVSIRDESEDQAERISGLISNLVEQGVKFTSNTLSWELVTPGPQVKKTLNLPRGAQCHLVRRIRFLSDLPISYASIFLPKKVGDLIEKQKNQDTLILQMLDKTPFVSDHMRFTMSATLAHGEAADLLGLPVGSAIMRMSGTAFSNEDEPVYYQDSLYHPDRYEYNVELVRDHSSGKIIWHHNS